MLPFGTMGKSGRPENNPIISQEDIVPLGTRIRLTRRLAGMDATKFAKAVGVTRQHISKIELGKDNPSPSLLDSICLQLGVSAGQLQELPGPQFTKWIEGKNQSIDISRSATPERPISGLRTQVERVEAGISTVNELAESLTWHAQRIEQLTQVLSRMSHTDSNLSEASFSPETDLIKLGTVLRDKRKELGIPTAVLSRKAGIGRTTVWVVERGLNPKTGKPSRPDKDLLERWGHGLRLSEEETKEVLSLAGYKIPIDK